ncbi:MAG TPA: nucleotide exchange factor GrpE [Solirubrobacteraceae bacterium]|jgi:molecular chaperone GrpE
MRETDEQATLAGEAAEQQASEDPGAGAAAPQGAGGAPGGATAPAGDASASEHDSEEQAALQGDVDELLQAVAKRDEYLALAQRTQADFENYRKRVAREAALSQQRGLAKLAKELLPAFDNLDRAIDAAAEGDPLLEGVQLVRKELHLALGRVGIESFSPKGERFDPAEHEAVAQQPFEGVESGCVAEVYQPGYRMGEMVIRPARVLVAA